MIRLVVELDDQMHQAIKVKAAQDNKTIKEIVIEMLSKWLKAKK